MNTVIIGLRNLAKYNFLSGLYLSQSIIITAGNFVITPLIISRLGNSTYVFWITANAFTSLLLLANWGFLNHFKVVMTNIYTRTGLFHLGIWKKAVIYMNYSSLVIGVILALTLRWVPIRNENSENQFLLLLLLGLLTSFLILLEHLFIMKFQVFNLEARSTSITLIYRICEVFVQILLLIIHPSIYLVFAVSLIGRTGSLMTIAIRAPTVDKQLYSQEKHDTSIIRTFQKSIGSLFFVLSNVVYANILILILSMILSTSTFTIFQISKMIAAPILMVGGSLATGSAQRLLIKGVSNSSLYDKLRFKELIFPLLILIGVALFLLLITPLVWLNFFPALSDINQKLICLIALQYIFDSFIWLISRDFYNLNRLFRIGFLNLTLSIFAIICVSIAQNQFSIQSIPLILVFFDVILLFFVIQPRGRKWLLQSV
jgi:hypothetical protein